MQFRIVFAICLVIFGCSSEKRAQRHLRIAERLDPKIITHLTDTIYIDSLKLDTMFVTAEIDTIRIDTGRLDIRIIRHFDTIRVTGGCETDTLIVTKTILKTVKKNRYIGLKIIIILILLAGIIIILKL